MKRHTVIAIALLVGLSHAVSGQVHPNLTGVWKLNPNMSKFASGEVPANLVIRFEIRDAILHETLTVTRSGSESTTTYNYDLNGKEIVNRIDDEQITTTSRWDGDALVLEWKDQGGISTRRFVFARDAKSMTMEVRDSNQDTQGVDSVVLEKQ